VVSQRMKRSLSTFPRLVAGRAEVVDAYLRGHLNRWAACINAWLQVALNSPVIHWFYFRVLRLVMWFTGGDWPAWYSWVPAISWVYTKLWTNIVVRFYRWWWNDVKVFWVCSLLVMIFVYSMANHCLELSIQVGLLTSARWIMVFRYVTQVCAYMVVGLSLPVSVPMMIPWLLVKNYVV